jgi:para-nitrobenzyl esterase
MRTRTEWIPDGPPIKLIIQHSKTVLSLEQVSAAMRAIPMGRRVRTGLAAGAAATAVLIAAAACTTATTTATPGTSKSAAQNRESGLVVATAGGAVHGKTVAATREFLGIPYAAPPVGALRWQPPRPAAPWHGTRSATSYGPHCPQPPGSFGRASTSEDCLYLNVFTPAGSKARNLPVMVWVHGGSLRTGESDDYNPAGLVRDGVVVVTINYRLGALGFLADSALASHPGGPAGNYGLMDQQAALRWVQRNIRGFGGDPGDVTLFGESAGGLSTLAQLVSPGARGLFQRAIVESGTYQLTQQSLATAESAGKTFAAKAGCASNTATCLRGLSVSTILTDEDPSGYTPDVDGAVLTQPVKTALSGGQFNRVPVVIGTNHDEYRLFVAAFQFLGARVTAANYQSMIASTLGVSAAIAGAIAAQYPLSRYPAGRARRGRHRRDLRLSRAHRRGVAGPVRADLRVRVQRRERARTLPAPGRLPLRRDPRLRAAVPVQPDHRHAPGTVQPGSAAARGGHEAGLDEPGQDRDPGRHVAALHRHQPADAVPGPARPARRDGLRRPAPLRVLGARTLDDPPADASGTDGGLGARVHHVAASREKDRGGSGLLGDFCAPWGLLQFLATGRRRVCRQC